MKTNLKTTGIVEIEEKDLLLIVKDYVVRTLKLNVTKVQRNDKKIVALVDGEINEGALPIATERKPRMQKKSNAGFNKRWTGFYGAVREIVDSQAAKKKHFISLEDLQEELKYITDENNKPKFVQDGEVMPMNKVRQYLSKSQLAKQSNMKGLKVAKDDNGNLGLKF